jgi:hypothetical protein
LHACIRRVDEGWEKHLIDLQKSICENSYYLFLRDYYINEEKLKNIDNVEDGEHLNSLICTFILTDYQHLYFS